MLRVSEDWLERGRRRSAKRTGEEVRAGPSGLPEHQVFADTGCEVHPACLSCPLVACRFDTPGGMGRVFLDARDEEMRRRRRGGATIAELQQRYKMSNRNVFRVLAAAR